MCLKSLEITGGKFTDFVLVFVKLLLLNMTKVELDLISDADMYFFFFFFEKSMRSFLIYLRDIARAI